jgi:hypothetical protein
VQKDNDSPFEHKLHISTYKYNLATLRNNKTIKN